MKPRPWSKRELLAYLDRVEPVLSKLSYFRLLDLPETASDKNVQDAFHTMAAGLHPDRHRGVLDARRHEQLIVVYARLAEAYRTLRTQKGREAYRKAMGTTDTAPIGDGDQLSLLSPKAQTMYRRAIAAANRGDAVSARLQLKMALAKHPQSTFLKKALAALDQV